MYPREVDFCTAVVGNVLVISQPVFDYMASEDSAWIKTGSDFSAGMSDTITGGLTGRLRGALGYNDVVDQQSSMYRYGGYAGQAVNIGLMFANPAAMAGWARTGFQVMNGMSQIGGLLNAAEAAGKGDFRTARTQLLGAAASRLRGRSEQMNFDTVSKTFLIPTAATAKNQRGFRLLAD